MATFRSSFGNNTRPRKKCWIHLILPFNSGQDSLRDPLSFTSSFPKLKKKQPDPTFTNNSLSTAAETPQEQKEISVPPSLLAANIWFSAMIHGGAAPLLLLLLHLPLGRGWDQVLWEGEKLFGVSHSLMESYPAGQGQDMFRWWLWWLRGKRRWRRRKRGSAYL